MAENSQDAAGVTIGQFELQELTLTSFNGTSIDIRNVYGILDIYEDLFGNVLSGSVTIIDSLNLAEKLPIIGQEKLTVQFKSAAYVGNQGKSRFVFDVYSVSLKTPVTEGAQAYKLEFFSPEMRWNLKTKLSQAYNGAPEDIANEILRRGLRSEKKIIVEPTKSKQHFIASNWQPFYTLNWLGKRTLSGKYFTGGFLFFENSDNEFHFCSVEALLDKDTVQKYTHVRGMQSNENATDRNWKLAFSNINSYVSQGVFNTADGMTMGMYGSRLYTFDPISKRYDQFDYSYKIEYLRARHLEDNNKGGALTLLEGLAPDKEGRMLSDYPDMDVRFYPQHTLLFDDTSSINVAAWYQSRNSLIQQMNQHKVVIEVVGDSSRKVGEVVELEIPAKQSTHGERELDNMNRGRFLTTSLRHTLIREGSKYVMTMELTKDSFFVPMRPKFSRS